MTLIGTFGVRGAARDAAVFNNSVAEDKSIAKEVVAPRDEGDGAGDIEPSAAAPVPMFLGVTVGCGTPIAKASVRRVVGVGEVECLRKAKSVVA